MIEQFLSELAAALHTSSSARARIVEEAREHIVDHASRLEREGVPPGDAIGRAVAAFGDAGTVARAFNAQAATTSMRRTPAAILAYAVVVIGIFLGTAVGARPAHATSASIALRVTFFAGTIGVQIAFVAGLRALSLVAARWRQPAAPAGERDVVRAAGVVSFVGLALAALSWSVALVLVFFGAHLRGDRSIAAGAVGLGVAAVLGGLALARLRTTSRFDTADLDAPDLGGLGAAGERVLRIVFDHPLASCAIVAIGSGLLTMHGAESTPLGALPSGLAEAAAVIGAFYALGPRLGLRAPSSARV